MKDKELAAFRNKKLGFVFQSFHLINSLNVLENVSLEEALADRQRSYDKMKDMLD